jgi:hypothetical protein
MARVQRFYLNDEGTPNIADILRLTREQVLSLASYIDKRGLSGSREDLLALANELGLSFEKTTDLVQYAQYLQAERSRLGLDERGLFDEFDIYLERAGLKGELGLTLSELSEPLRKLFANRPQLALREKVVSVTAGVIPQAVDFRSLCDLRPIFDEQREKILEYIIVALVRVFLRSETGEDSTAVFQLDAEGIDKLEKFLGQLKSKMEALKSVRNRLVGDDK